MFDRLKSLIGDKKTEKSQLEQYDDALNEAADQASKDLSIPELMNRNMDDAHISPIEKLIKDPKVREDVYIKRLRDKSNIFPSDISEKLSEKLMDIKDPSLNANKKLHPDIIEEPIKRQFEMGKKAFNTNGGLKIENNDEAVFNENGETLRYHGYTDTGTNTVKINKDNYRPNTVFHELLHTKYKPKAAEDVNTMIPRDDRMIDNISFLQNQHIDNADEVRKDTGANISLGENYDLFKAIKAAMKKNLPQ